MAFICRTCRKPIPDHQVQRIRVEGEPDLVPVHTPIGARCTEVRTASGKWKQIRRGLFSSFKQEIHAVVEVPDAPEG